MEKHFLMHTLKTHFKPLCAVALVLLLSACTTTTTQLPSPPVQDTPELPSTRPALEPELAPVEVLAPIDPLRPDVKVDLDASTAQTDLWVRLRRGFAMPDLVSPLVQDREQWYTSRPEYMQRMSARGSRYLFHVIEEVERRGMPSELALLPFIESAFNPQAISSAKASGMWQFMPATGRHFALRQNIFRDDRRDVLASTRAALDYLGKLHRMFGDWHLALAAYNWGEGSVQRAINRNRQMGLPTDYLSLRMPNETQYYVPKLQAVKNIFARPEVFGITLPPLENHPYFLSVPIERDIDVTLAMALAGVSRDEFLTLNPQMKKPVILAAGTPQVLLPYRNASQFVANLRRHRGPLATWTAWVAPRTMRMKDAAQQVGMSAQQLREVNAIRPAMMVKAGSTLLVPRSANRQQDVSVQLADHATMALVPEPPPLQRLTLRATRKDSIRSVARRYHLSPAQVAQWNKTSVQSRFKPGQTVVLFVPVRTLRTLRSRSAVHGHRSRTVQHRSARVTRLSARTSPSRGHARRRHR
jgi:membrane-bound lytic murein transglycosylase D